MGKISYYGVQHNSTPHIIFNNCDLINARVLEGVVIPFLNRKEKVIVINKLKPLEQRIQSLARAFSQLDISNIHMKPAIREFITSEVIDS